MGCATRGGGAVESGPANKMLSETSKTTGPVRMKKGGMANKGGMNEHKRMAMGKPVGKMGGGMMTKAYKKAEQSAKWPHQAPPHSTCRLTNWLRKRTSAAACA
jgi:hypothetical protein